MRVPWIAPTTTAEIMLLLALRSNQHSSPFRGSHIRRPMHGQSRPVSDFRCSVSVPSTAVVGDRQRHGTDIFRDRPSTAYAQDAGSADALANAAVRVSRAHHFFSWLGISLLEVSDPPSKPRYNPNVYHFISTSITFGLQAFVLFTHVQSSIVQCMLS